MRFDLFPLSWMTSNLVNARSSTPMRYNFINQLILYSVADNVQSIMDGLKPGQCKILNVNETTSSIKNSSYTQWPTAFDLFLQLWMASNMVNTRSFWLFRA